MAYIKFWQLVLVMHVIGHFKCVMGWSADNAFMASFKEEKAPQGIGRIRMFDRVMDLGDDVFGISDSQNRVGKSIVWGAREKMYFLSSMGLEVADYNPNPTRSKRKNTEYPMFAKRGLINESIDIDQVVTMRVIHVLHHS